jgi:ATP-dependent RNA helicase DHX29
MGSGLRVEVAEAKDRWDDDDDEEDVPESWDADEAEAGAVAAGCGEPMHETGSRGEARPASAAGPASGLPEPCASPRGASSSAQVEAKKSAALAASQRESRRLQAEWESTKGSDGWQALWRTRQSLPIYHCKDALLDAVRHNSVVILVGQTGCGKSTQVPQMILDREIEGGSGATCRIICTQPRRVAALGLSERVAAERCERLGTAGALTAHQIRMESTKTAATRLLFCTTGILLRMLQDTSEELSDVSHLIVDEAHERDVLCDFLLIILRDLVKTRPQLRVVIMSATMDAQRFADYFGTTQIFEVPGRTFPVTDYYLEDILEATGHVISQGHPCALRQGHSCMGSEKLQVTAKGGKTASMTATWGEEDIDGLGPTNDLYDDSIYLSFSKTTKLSLRRVNEERINYELILGNDLFVDACSMVEQLV